MSINEEIKFKPKEQLICVWSGENPKRQLNLRSKNMEVVIIMGLGFGIDDILKRR